MDSIRATVLVVGFAAFDAPPATAQVPEHVKTQIEKLGPEGLIMVPKSFAEFVKLAQAAVIVEIIALGDIVFEPTSTRAGTYLGTDAFTTYNVEIREVLFNRAPSAPPLAVGGRVDLTQLVGRELAQAFVNKQGPIVAGDQCLLYLWFRPGARVWSILQWPFQFRRLSGEPDQAEPLSARPWHTAGWFGPAIPLVTGADKVRLKWTALVTATAGR